MAIKLSEYITRCYSSVRHKSKRRGHEVPAFSKIELTDWLYKNGLERMWIVYIESGCDVKFRPSIDRIDDYKGYFFENMQLITWRENHMKGCTGVKHKERSTGAWARKPVVLYDKFGNKVGRFVSGIECCKYLNCHIGSVTRVVTGMRKSIKGHTVALEQTPN